MITNAAPDVENKMKALQNQNPKERSRSPLQHNHFSTIKIKNLISILIIV